MYEEGLKTDMYFWDEKKCEENEIKNVTVLNSFVFSRTDFILTKKKVNFYVCLSKEGKIFSCWNHPIKDENGIEYTPSEVMSLFRKGFTQNSINQEMINLFLNEPKKFKRKFVPKTKRTA